MIPAGAAHQVCNLADCIKVACDFVSPRQYRNPASTIASLDCSYLGLKQTMSVVARFLSKSSEMRIQRACGKRMSCNSQTWSGECDC
jgi:hypothetical protein